MKNFMSAVFKVPLTVFFGAALSSCGVMALAQSKLAVATAKPVLVAYGSTGPLVQDSPSLSPVWVDTHAKTFVVGFVWLYQDNTCRLYPGQQGISAIRAPLHGKVFFTQENLTNPPGSWCAGHTYLYWVARYTWTDADETTLEDPVTLQSTDVYQGYTSTDNYSFAAMFAHIVADPVAASGSNAQGTQQDVANSNLIDPPQGAARYTWTMTGGAGILAFSNGAPSMTTTTSTAPVVSLNGASDTINVSVTVSYPAGSNSLSYGPGKYTYLGSQILFGGNIVSSTDASSPPPTQDVVVGQDINMTTAPPPPGYTISSSTWTIGGTSNCTDGTCIGDYSPSKSGATVIPIDSGDLTDETALELYWVYPTTSKVPVTYKYCVNELPAPNNCSPTATAYFNVTGPTGGNMSFDPITSKFSIPSLTACSNPSMSAGPYLEFGNILAGSSCPGGISRAYAVGITFNSPTGYSNTAGGAFSITQLVNSDVVNGACCTTGAKLDFLSISLPANDTPGLYLPAAATLVTRNFTANTFLMWQSSTTNSIPVPLGYRTWNFYGSASCSAVCSVASSWTPKVLKLPDSNVFLTPSVQSLTPIQLENNVDVDGYPTW